MKRKTIGELVVDIDYIEKNSPVENGLDILARLVVDYGWSTDEIKKCFISEKAMATFFRVKEQELQGV